MSHAHIHIRPDSHIFLHLPSDLLKLIEVKPNTIVDIGKLGSFPSNLLLGRPYYHTYELLEKRRDEAHSRLRMVPAFELNDESVLEDVTPSESRGDPATPPVNGVPEGYDLLADDGTVIMKNNRLTIDDASRQALSQQEIEELKKSSGGKEIIEKILANHAGLEEKTAFSKAKYTLRKSKKYLKRFTILPMDLRHVVEYVLQKEPPRIMEFREETLGLIAAWSNAHFSDIQGLDGLPVARGRWLVSEDTGGLVVAALAERMDILRMKDSTADGIENGHPGLQTNGNAMDHSAAEAMEGVPQPPAAISKVKQHRDFPLPASSNTITLLHPAIQPNTSLLKYFDYDTNQPDSSHPLHTHMKTLSWLQLLQPEEDSTYREPERVSDQVLQSWKSGKRGSYWKKRRRWERCRSIVDEARAGGFDGLVVASSMDPVTIVPHTVPLLRGGAHVVVYSPTIEPLVNLMDLYGKERRTAYIQHLAKGEEPDPADFPTDPRLLLAPTLQTSRVRDWQVLPGRTHPLMTGRGAAEGYVFTARKVIPLDGGVEARGNFNTKKRKVDPAAAEPVDGLVMETARP